MTAPPTRLRLLEDALERTIATYRSVQWQLTQMPDVASRRQTESSGLRAYLKVLEREIDELSRQIDALGVASPPASADGKEPARS